MSTPCPRCGHPVEDTGRSRKLRRHRDSGECRAILTLSVRRTALQARGYVLGRGLYLGGSLVTAMDALLPPEDKAQPDPEPNGSSVWLPAWVGALYDAACHDDTGRFLGISPETHPLRGLVIRYIARTLRDRAYLQADVLNTYALGGAPAVRSLMETLCAT